MLQPTPPLPSPQAISWPVNDALRSAVLAWQDALLRERRLSANTVEAYGRDLRQFLVHRQARHGEPCIADLIGLKPRDLRGFMAARRGEGHRRALADAGPCGPAVLCQAP